mgnify:CR=1 FL=1
MNRHIVIAGGPYSRSVQAFDTQTRTWRHLSQMNRQRHAASSVVYQGRIIVTGGLRGRPNDRNIDVEELAEINGDWAEGPRLRLQNIFSHVCLVYRGRLLVIGGQFQEDGVSNEIRQIRLTEPYETVMSTMPQAICYHGAVNIGKTVYIIGGTTTGHHSGATSTVRTFNAETGNFEQLKPLQYAVSEMATVMWYDNVFVIGGRNSEGHPINTVMMYNVTCKTWRSRSAMASRRSGCTAVTINDSIMVMGGLGDENALTSVEVYNCLKDTWTNAPGAMAEPGAYSNAEKYP